MRELNNYNRILKDLPEVTESGNVERAIIHKNEGAHSPRVSLILLDWSCRESFHTLDWLARQDVPRKEYELIWVELYERCPEEAMVKCDKVISCRQRGMYHKHKGYNFGVSQAKGDLIVICDSDAVFPPDFISSIFSSFKAEKGELPIPLVLMHHQWRTSFLYPEKLEDTKTLADSKWNWWDLVPNAGACLTFRKDDIIRFGGFDEDESYRGYFCGGYELAWRLVNAGYPEIWYDPHKVALWHFAHPDPIGSNEIPPSFKRLRENTYPHVDLHAIMAVDAASSGRLLPLKENPEIWGIRMKNRRFGLSFEEKFSVMTGPEGFPPKFLRKEHRRLMLEVFLSLPLTLFSSLFSYIDKKIFNNQIKPLFKKLVGRTQKNTTFNDPVLIEEGFLGYNIVLFECVYFGIPQHLGIIDFQKRNEIFHPSILRKKSLQGLKDKIRGSKNL